MADIITIGVENISIDHVVMFRIKSTTKLKKVFKAYAQRYGLKDPTLLRFFTLNGQRLLETDTPESIHIGDGDNIKFSTPSDKLLTNLYKICRSNKLSLDALQKEVDLRGPIAIWEACEECGYLYMFFNKACRNKKITLEIINYLLETFPEAASLYLPLVDDRNYFTKPPIYTYLEYNINVDFEIVKVLYDAYPEAIEMKDYYDGARTKHKSNESLLNFMAKQCEYALQAKDTALMHTLHRNGVNDRLPFHYALIDGAPLGSIKLLLKSNPFVTRIVDNQLAFPLHLACEYSSVEVVKFLVRRDSFLAFQADANKYSILHYACRGCNLRVIKYLLTSHAPLVSLETVNTHPIHLLCQAGKEGRGGVDCESPEYIETIWLMLLANPEIVTLDTFVAPDLLQSLSITS